MLSKRTGAPAWLLLFLSTRVLGDCSSLSPMLDSMLVEHLAELRGNQYCTQTYQSNRLELVVYFVENPCYSNDAPAGSCGNRTLAFLAGIERGRQLAPIKIGESGDFVPQQIRVDGSVIVVSGKSYARGEPTCCPSIASERRVRVTPGGFILTLH